MILVFKLLGAEGIQIPLQYSLDTERTVNGNVGGICKSIKLNVAGVRIKWDSHVVLKVVYQGLFTEGMGTTIQAASSNMNNSYETLTLDTDVKFWGYYLFKWRKYGSVNYTRKIF